MVIFKRADKIDKMIADFQSEVSNTNNTNGEYELVTTKKLYEKIFIPLQRKLGQVKTIFISSDGSLNLLPFEVLQRPDNRFLIEDYTFNYLASGRDLLGFQVDQDAEGICLLIGDPDFDFSLGKRQSVDENTGEGNPVLAAALQRSVNLNDVTFAPLTHAREELEAIGQILGDDRAKLFIGQQAHENVLNDNPPPLLFAHRYAWILSQ